VDLKLTDKIYVYDTTLRDGVQGEGIAFSVNDKLSIIKKLDQMGLDYIEAGNPGSNPKDMELFEKLKGIKLKHARVAAFGSTRRANIKASEDSNLLGLLKAETSVVTIFGKTWDFHVTDIIKTTLKENLNMIKDSVTFLKSKGKEVVFDAEHFFDGYKANQEYSLKVLQTAYDAGADSLVLCDTNGGSMPSEISDIVKKVSEFIPAPLGIHCHNDCGMAVANSIAAVENGILQVQGTINGYGERCGNANLCTFIPTAQLKMRKRLIPEKQLEELTSLSRYVSELANQTHNENDPFVGGQAFAHKGGMHIDAVLKATTSYEHIEPEKVGNSRKILMSEVAGRSAVLGRIQEVIPWVRKESPIAVTIIEQLKSLEHQGYQFEGAEGSFELMVRKVTGNAQKFFSVIDFTVLCENLLLKNNSVKAIAKVEVNGIEEITAVQGDGPVNALDKALRKALEPFYPELKKMRLLDYKVRVIDTTHATAAKVRVHIESTDGTKVWGTVGVSTNIIEASYIALMDSIEYFLEDGSKKSDEVLETFVATQH
jgi:2-isopropylmalate synthase